MFQTNRLVIVGGTSAVGKSTLLERMRQGDVPHLCDQLDVDLPSSYLYRDAMQLPKILQSSVDRLVLHYDIFYQYSPGDGFAYLPDLIGRSCGVVVLTLCTSSEVLFQRTTQRLKRALVSFLCRPGRHTAKNIRSRWRMREWYRSATNLFGHYVKWAEFIEESGVAKHLIIDHTNFDFTMDRPYERNEIKILTGALSE